MKIAPEILREIGPDGQGREENQRGVVSLRGALRSQVRLLSRSKRVIPAFRKQWAQTTSF